MTAGHDDWITERVEHERELQERRRQWEENRKAAAEKAERDAKRAELESYLQRRSREWQDTTGSEPPLRVLDAWQQQFMDEKELLHQAEREARLAAAEAEYGF